MKASTQLLLIALLAPSLVNESKPYGCDLGVKSGNHRDVDIVASQLVSTWSHIHSDSYLHPRYNEHNYQSSLPIAEQAKEMHREQFLGQAQEFLSEVPEGRCFGVARLSQAIKVYDDHFYIMSSVELIVSD